MTNELYPQPIFANPNPNPGRNITRNSQYHACYHRPCSELQYNSLDSAAATAALAAPENVIAKRDNGANSGVEDSPNGSASVMKLGSGNSRLRNSKPTRSDYYDSYPNGQQSVTGTPKPPTTELDDLLISVKTTKGYHDTRLEMITKTWYQLAKEQCLRRYDALFARELLDSGVVCGLT
ncbi:AAEL012068-PA [Aedes aegypti]|uniref:AAEL012068-PA n=1 Tax=Aedes aegypti TaxID=7159 RepID=Q16N73_AEDAE|nr:AAEL012068-PA [Aedes aegypti]